MPNQIFDPDNFEFTLSECTFPNIDPKEAAKIPPDKYDLKGQPELPQESDWTITETRRGKGHANNER